MGEWRRTKERAGLDMVLGATIIGRKPFSEVGVWDRLEQTHFGCFPVCDCTAKSKMPLLFLGVVVKWAGTRSRASLVSGDGGGEREEAEKGGRRATTQGPYWMDV